MDTIKVLKKSIRDYKLPSILTPIFIIGEVVFGKLFINFGLRLFAVSIGAILYYIVLQAALQLGLNTNDLKLVTALIVAVFLAIPYWKGKAFHGKAQKGGAHHA